MDNLFTYAPKELSNSAMWTWIISGLRHPDLKNPRYQIARNMFELFSIPVPKPESIAELHAEYAFKTLGDPNGASDIPPPKRKKEEGKDGGQLDIFLRMAWPEPSVLFVENKVKENDVVGLFNQIKRYDDHLQHISRHKPDYCRRVYPAYFGYEGHIVDDLRQYSALHDPELSRRLILFSAVEMLSVMEGVELDSELVLGQFYEWLSVKREFVYARQSARLKSHVDVSQVIQSASAIGFGALLQEFMDEFERCRALRSQIREVRVDTQNINFYGKGKGTPITIRWYKDSGPNGLYVGVHKNVEKMLDMNLFQGLPGDFSHIRDAEWLFGYLRTSRDIQNFFAGAR